MDTRGRPDDSDLMTTGEVADLLGTTTRHVVNLTIRGELPYTMAGTHRRIRRADALLLARRPAGAKGGPMTDDQLRSLWLHRVAAGRVARYPTRSLRAARRRIAESLRSDPAGQRWLRDWLLVIDRGPEAVMRTLTSIDPEARELRQNSPFVGLLTETERKAVIRAFHATYQAMPRTKRTS
jgi:excisionase family DNA binding protein